MKIAKAALSAKAAVDLLWDADCAGCGAYLAGPLCSDCRLQLFGIPSRREADAPRLVPADGGPSFPVWSSAWYSAEVRRVIVAWKRRGRSELEPELTLAMRRSARAVGRLLAEISPRIAVVPIPSRRLRAWKRPDGTRALAKAVAEGLSEAGLAVEVVQALSRRASAGEQSGRSQRQRLLGRDGTTTVRKPVSAPVLLVDDVLTTGATLLDAERALAGAGSLTLGALVLAVTRAESASV